MRQAVRVMQAAGAMVLLSIPLGCAHVKVDPIEVKTIHIQHDVTIGVDKALEDFFAFQERSATEPAGRQPASSTAPTTAPATMESATTQTAGI